MGNVGERAGLYTTEGINISVLEKLNLQCTLHIQVKTSHRQSDIQGWSLGTGPDWRYKFEIHCI